MSPDKTHTIFDRWPAWFDQAKDPQASLMKYGFECGDGWYEIVYNLFERLEPLVAGLDSSYLHFQVVQGKEKFGELRIYLNGSTDEMDQVINDAISTSKRTCEECGQPGTLQHGVSGWMKTLCAECQSKRMALNGR